MKKLITFLITTFCISTGFSDSPYLNNSFFNQLKSKNNFVHTTLTTEWHPNYSQLYFFMNSQNEHVYITVDKTYLKMASGVTDPHKIWQFKDNSLNNHFIHLFQTISSGSLSLGFQVTLSQYDLFHGHLFALHTTRGTLDDIGILFHAKEFPRDLALGNADAEKNSPFTSESPEYRYRNFIWMASTGVIYNIDSDSSEIFPTDFLPEGLDVNDPSMHDIIQAYLKARTFMIDHFRGEVELLGDINCFIIDEKPVIFFTKT